MTDTTHLPSPSTPPAIPTSKDLKPSSAISTRKDRKEHLLSETGVRQKPDTALKKLAKRNKEEHSKDVENYKMRDSTREDGKRPIIAAMIKGPGPAAFNLPSLGKANYKGKSSPAYSFGRRVQPPKGTSDIVPAPNSFLPQVMRTGKQTNYQFSLRGRWTRDEHRPNSVTPGPSDYNVHPIEKSIPAPRLLGRWRNPKADNLPGPGHYEIHSRFPKRPETKDSNYEIASITITTDATTITLPKKPITASQERIQLILERKAKKEQEIKEKKEREKAAFPMVDPPHFGKDAPHISLKGRFNTTFFLKGPKKIPLPGPGAYTPKPIDKKPPAFSFRTRHSDFTQYVPEAFGKQFVCL